MAIHRLKLSFCQQVKTNGLHSDGGNLYLQVTNDGAAKSWVFRWTCRRTKRQRTMGLGSLDAVDVAKARQEAQRCRELLQAGKDPIAEREAARLESAITAGQAKAVRQVVDEFFDAKIKHLSPHRRKGFNGVMGRHVLKAIGDMPIAKVTRAIVLDVVGLRKKWETIHPTAEQLQCDLKNIFSFEDVKSDRRTLVVVKSLHDYAAGLPPAKLKPDNRENRQKRHGDRMA